MRSLLALILAVAMIAGALVYRLDRDGGAGLDLAGDGAEPALVCITELAAVCKELAESQGVAVTIEPAGVTAAALSAGNPPTADGWLTLAPWRDLTAEARARSGGQALPAASGAILGRSPLVLVVAKEREPSLADPCKGDVNWRCVGQVSGTPWFDIGGDPAWGNVKPGFADPSTSATGLLVLGAAAGDFFGRSKFSAADLNSDGFLGWADELAHGAGDHGSVTNSPVAQQLQFGPARYDVVGTTEAEAGPAHARSARADDFVISYPQTPAVAEVVLAQLRPGDGAAEMRTIIEESGVPALAAAGWRVPGEQAADGVEQRLVLPQGSNLPPAGVLDALRLRWEEVSK